MSLLYVGSDFHWGNCSERDDFRSHRVRFIESVKKIPASAEIILLGDVIDVWSYKSILDILSCYQDCINQLSTRKVFFVRGNHDPDIDTLKVYLPPTFTFCERMVLDEIYFCHGHEWDLLNSRWHHVGKFITYIGQLIGLASPSIEDTIHCLVKKIQGKGRYSNHEQFVHWAENFIEFFSNASIGVVCGHTHIVKHEKILNHKQYLNTGIWIENGWTIIKNGHYLGNVF